VSEGGGKENLGEVCLVEGRKTRKEKEGAMILSLIHLAGLEEKTRR